MAELDSLFQELVERKASDLHLAVGLPIKMRIDGELRIVRERKLTEDDAERLMREIVSEARWESFLEDRDLDFSCGLSDVVRLRVNYFFHHRGVGAIFRVIPTRILTCEELGVPKAIVNLARLPRGLVLVTGPTGSGKSTTLAALIDTINANAHKHIITIEEPIEYVHEDQSSVIVQREVGVDTASFARALRGAVREDPDVILVGELRDLETVSLTLEAAEMGFLVFGTLHTNSAAKTMDRIVDLFSPERQAGIRITLAASLRGVVSQQLLRRAGGKGRVAVHEILLASQAVANVIREGRSEKLFSIIQAGRGAGMQTMDQALQAAVDAGMIEGKEAWRKAHQKALFERYID